METSIKQQCWNMWVGDNEQTHRCFSCEKWIVRKTCFQCAYFISEVKGGVIIQLIKKILKVLK